MSPAATGRRTSAALDTRAMAAPAPVQLLARAAAARELEGLTKQLMSLAAYEAEQGPDLRREGRATREKSIATGTGTEIGIGAGIEIGQEGVSTRSASTRGISESSMMGASSL
jgi:hypothetical protein